MRASTKLDNGAHATTFEPIIYNELRLFHLKNERSKLTPSCERISLPIFFKSMQLS